MASDLFLREFECSRGLQSNEIRFEFTLLLAESILIRPQVSGGYNPFPALACGQAKLSEQIGVWMDGNKE